jgi:hypothetical protein
MRRMLGGGNAIIRLTTPISITNRRPSIGLQSIMPKTTTKKKTTATAKRKTEDHPDEPSSSKAAPAKKAKGPTVPLHPHLPNNKVFPAKLEIAAKMEDTLRISAWCALETPPRFIPKF